MSNATQSLPDVAIAEIGRRQVLLIGDLGVPVDEIQTLHFRPPGYDPRAVLIKTGHEEVLLEGDLAEAFRRYVYERV